MTPYQYITTYVTECIRKEINYAHITGKGKVIPLQARFGPEGG